MQAQKPFEYTLSMETIFQGKLSELKSYYCREDFGLALADYDHAPKDAKSFRMRDVSRLCNARGIEAKALIVDRSILESIPTRSAMQDELLQAFCYLETDHTQQHRVFGTAVRDKVKGNCFAYIAVQGLQFRVESFLLGI